MSAMRQDAWSEEEDVMLADIVIRHIRNGSTQLAAFEEVGQRLQRTAAACGFRWNSTIRKKYESEIQDAKEERKRKKTGKKNEKDKKASSSPPTNMTLEDVIAFLQQLQHQEETPNKWQYENMRLKEELVTMKNEYEEKIKRMKEEYKTVSAFIEQAKEWVSQQKDSN